MNQYSDFPPILTFKKVLQNAPKSAYLFLQLWSSKPPSGSLTIKKEDIHTKFSCTPTIFKNNVRDLSKIDIVKFEQDGENYKLKL
jgi:hypothetical protein